MDMLHTEKLLAIAIGATKKEWGRIKRANLVGIRTTKRSTGS